VGPPRAVWARPARCARCQPLCTRHRTARGTGRPNPGVRLVRRCGLGCFLFLDRRAPSAAVSITRRGGLFSAGHEAAGLPGSAFGGPGAGARAYARFDGWGVVFKGGTGSGHGTRHGCMGSEGVNRVARPGLANRRAWPAVVRDAYTPGEPPTVTCNSTTTTTQPRVCTAMRLPPGGSAGHGVVLAVSLERPSWRPATKVRWKIRKITANG